MSRGRFQSIKTSDTRKVKGDLDGAVEDYSRAIELKYRRRDLAYLGRADALRERAEAQRSVDDVDGALRDYEDASRFGRSTSGASVYRLVEKVMVARKLKQELLKGTA